VQRGRFLWFLLSITIGIGAGLVYGWAVHPIQSRNASLPYLSADYKADYVLMVAEVYSTEQDPGLAAHRLTLLNDVPAVRTVQEAIISAGQLNYSAADVELLVRLAQGLSQKPAPVSTAAPAVTPGATP
jgi:hypothetical protein